MPPLVKELERLYPDAVCSLTYETPFQLLVSTQLSAQCTDARVNMVTPALFARFPDAQAFAAADIEELEELIRSTGFYHNKAKNLKRCAQDICDKFGGTLPDTMEGLLSLAGVGRKTANLVLGDAFHKPSYVIDTACHPSVRTDRPDAEYRSRQNRKRPALHFTPGRTPPGRKRKLLSPSGAPRKSRMPRSKANVRYLHDRRARFMRLRSPAALKRFYRMLPFFPDTARKGCRE